MDSVPTASRVIYQPGVYVRYSYKDNCALRIDTFELQFPKFPKEGQQAYSCPGAGQGRKVFFATDSFAHTYQWLDRDHNLLRSVVSSTGDTMQGLDTGVYFLRLATGVSCDTLTRFEVLPLPVPEAVFSMAENGCIHEPVHIVSATTAPQVSYFFPYDTVAAKDVVHTFDDEGPNKVIQVVMNAEGCRDTAQREILIHSLELSVSSDRLLVDKNDNVILITFANEPYSILSWEPAFKFAGQNALSQQIVVDTTIRVIAKGVSQYGCEDTALLSINVRPRVFLPTAFSPNGDGLNDRFRPVSIGAPVFIRYFRIYNRWGQQVYYQQGSSAETGWDGRIQDGSAEVGTYYYVIEMESPQAETIYRKGDVILLR